MSSRGYLSWLLAACCVAVVVLVGNSPLVLGRAAPIWDADAYYGPMFSLVSDYAKSGSLLLWNPLVNGGSPDFADPQVGASSPVLLTFGLVSQNPFHGFIAYWLVFWVAGGVGMLLLCRHLKCPVWGAAIVALGFVACGVYTGHAEHTTILYSFSFVPWITLCFDSALAKRSYSRMACSGGLWGLSGLGGYPALVILDVLFLAFWAAGRFAFSGDEGPCWTAVATKPRLQFNAVSLLLFGVIGALVLSPCYIGFMKYTVGYTTRTGGVSPEYAEIGPFPPQAIGTFASPILYLLNLPPYRIWPETDVSLGNFYVGVLVMCLAAAGLSSGRKWRMWLFMVVLFFLACAVGKHLPLRGWVYSVVVPTRYFRFPSLFAAYAGFLLCILAAYGARDLQKTLWPGSEEPRVRYVLSSAGLAIVAGVCFVWILKSAGLKTVNVAHATRVFLLLWVGAAVWFALWWQRDLSRRLFLAGLMLIALYDSVTALKFSMPTMYSSASISWWHIMASKHVRSLDMIHGLDRTLYPPDELGRYQQNRNIPLRIPTFANITGMLNAYSAAYITDPLLTQIAVGEDRIWFSDQPVWLAPTEKEFSKYLNTSHRLGVPPLVLHTPREMTAKSAFADFVSTATLGGLEIPNASAMSRAKVELLDYRPNQLRLRYNSPSSGWLLVTDRWAPDWNATVNGKSVEITGANFLFRAVPVGAGENTIAFDYRPRGYPAMVAVSWGVISILLFGELVRFALCGRRGSALKSGIHNS